MNKTNKNKKQIKIIKIKKHNKIKENKKIKKSNKIKKNNKIKKMKENKSRIKIKKIKINNKQSNFMNLINKQKLYNIIMIIINKNYLLKKMKTYKMIDNNSKMLFQMKKNQINPKMWRIKILEIKTTKIKLKILKMLEKNKNKIKIIGEIEIKKKIRMMKRIRRIKKIKNISIQISQKIPFQMKIF